MTHPPRRHRIAVIALEGLGDAPVFDSGNTPANIPGTLSYVLPSAPPPAAAPTGPRPGTLFLYAGAALLALAFFGGKRK
jgi:LPXTG-motif cell wall-anchored protein